MKIDIYAICWNEADLLPFFFAQYDQIASRYFIFDDGSTDGSLDILRQHPKVTLHRFERKVAESFVLSVQVFQDNIWKQSRGTADWVILTAIDEHLVHADLRAYLAKATTSGVTAIPAMGFQMISDRFPKPGQDLHDLVHHGAPFRKMNKLGLFRPDQISETRFATGRHSARPIGNVVYPERDELLNLHFKYLDFERLKRRHQLLQSGLGPGDNARGFGHRYRFDDAQLRADWDGFAALAVDLHAPGFQPERHHADTRWWRQRPKPEQAPAPAGWLSRLWAHLKLPFGVSGRGQ